MRLTTLAALCLATMLAAAAVQMLAHLLGVL